MQEQHFPALDFKCGDESPQAKVDNILIYTFGCKFLGGKKSIMLRGQMKTNKSSVNCKNYQILAVLS